MKKLIAICPNPFRDLGLELTKKAISILETEGYETAVCPVFGADDSEAIPKDVVLSSWENVKNDAELFVVIGGDGTILEAARKLDYANKPILGVNLGTKGFMAALEPEDIELIKNAAAGNYVSGERMMIDVSLIRDGKPIYTACGLNDAVIHAMGDCIKLTAFCGTDKVTSFSGDGIIVATPTGSTGYSMSAGGPIAEPEVQAIIVTPICAHAMGAKPFVLGQDRTITVKADKIHDRRAYISVDGGDGIEIKLDDTIIVKKSKKTVNLVNMGQKSFYDMTFDKLLYKNI